MQIDVATLYCLIVGTAFVGAALTAWQRHFIAAHRREMGLWAIGQFAIGLGCLARVFHERLPDFIAIGLSNLAVLAGYAAITGGAMLFGRGRTSRAFLLAVAVMAVVWLLWGQHAPLNTRIVCTALMTFALSVQAALALRKRDDDGPLPAQRLMRAMLLLHGLFFLGRAAVTFTRIEGDILFTGTNFAVTMVEGVLWSAFVPVGLLAMVREKTERRLIAASETDFLTGVDNRRAFMSKATRLLADDAPASVAIFDLDHFKTINDRHGHALGDQVLREFCRVARSEMSVGDIFGRLGGEEFAAVFRNCDGAEALAIVTAISTRYTGETALGFTLSLRATTSAGIAEARPGAELAELLGQADGALYQAKKNGRDQALIADTRSAAVLPATWAA